MRAASDKGVRHKPAPARGQVADRILLVEDSRFFANVVERQIRLELGLEVLTAATLGEAVRLVEQHGETIFLALLDLVLPDAPNGEILETIRGHQIPSIVFSASYTDDVRDRANASGAIDFVVKDSPASFRYLIDQIGRIFRNRSITALVVDDSSTARQLVRGLLESQQLAVVEARNGKEALGILDTDRSIRIAITDYAMPEMDGFEFIKQARRVYDKETLAIIGVSATDNAPLSARFLKAGANDFLNKPFLQEEFICRISQNLTLLERMDHLRDAATTDPLTGLHNRRYFFDAGEGLHAKTQRGDTTLIAAMIDVDHFKQVNDSHGHDGGDLVLRVLADLLIARRRKTDIVARFGGEEFCYLLVDMAPEHAFDFFESLRLRIAELSIEYGGRPIPVTASIGVASTPSATLEDLIRNADAMLYHAKESGRNRVVQNLPQTQAAAS